VKRRILWLTVLSGGLCLAGCPFQPAPDPAQDAKFAAFVQQVLDQTADDTEPIATDDQESVDSDNPQALADILARADEIMNAAAPTEEDASE
jgi:hypothetical protein